MADKWREVVLRTIRETPSRTKPGTGFGLWVVMKTKNGACYNVTVRAGGFFTDKVTGERKLPKDGLTDYDFSALKKVWTTEIAPLIDHKNPPPVPTVDALPPAEKPSDDISMPW